MWESESAGGRLKEGNAKPASSGFTTPRFTARHFGAAVAPSANYWMSFARHPMRERIEICTNCHQPDPNGQVWDFGDLVLCQECWEEFCNQKFWEAVCA